jgi:hypothetical protein
MTTGGQITLALIPMKRKCALMVAFIVLALAGCATSPSNEIPNYDQGHGYRVRCADGMYSKSGGLPGACSGHGGES